MPFLLFLLKIKKKKKEAQIDKELTGHTSSVNSLAILPDQSIVSGSNDFSLKIW